MTFTLTEHELFTSKLAEYEEAGIVGFDDADQSYRYGLWLRREPDIGLQQHLVLQGHRCHSCGRAAIVDLGFSEPKGCEYCRGKFPDGTYLLKQS
jgi:ribosomal protein L37AE/L43A